MVSGLAIVGVVAFLVHFTWGILTGHRILLHPDIYTYYFPFRRWFTERLAEGRLPLWNPYWGIGHPAEAWGTIPLDLYTPLELWLGPHYHVFHAVQAFALVGAGTYAFTRLGFSRALSAAAALLFLVSPWVSYFFLYFMKTHSFIASLLLFAFVWRWLESGRRGWLVLVTCTTALSMLGTKPELWFFQTVHFTFVALAGGVLKLGIDKGLRAGAVAVAAMALGIAMNAWQLAIIVQGLHVSGRTMGGGFAQFVSLPLYRSLALSLVESLLLKLLIVAALLVVALSARGRRAVALGGLAAAVALVFSLDGRPVMRPDSGLRNGSLESWAGELPESFSYVRDGEGGGVDAVLEGRDGGTAARIQPGSAGQSLLRYEVTDPARYRGRLVRVTFWARAARSAPGAVQADLQDGVGGPVLAVLALEPTWRRFSVERHVASDARFVLFTLNVTAVAPAPVIVDDFELEASTRPLRALATRDGPFLGLLVSFITGPVMAGGATALLFVVVLGDRDWRRHLRTSALFLLLVYYLCRQGRGDLGELEVLRAAPVAWTFSLSAFVWLGCRGLRENTVARLAYLSIVFIFLMRDQGFIVISHLAGWEWIPTRDSYLVDLGFVVLAVAGLESLRQVGAAWSKAVAEVAAVAAVIAVWMATWTNPSWAHPLVGPAPPGYPHDPGAPNLIALMRTLGPPASTRAFFANESFMELHHVMGASLAARLPQVSLYASLTSARYRDWTIFRRLGIRPEQRWRGWSNELSAGTLRRLPRTNTLGYPNTEIYISTLIARPPLRRDSLELLGVTHVLHLYPAAAPYVVNGPLRVTPGIEAALRRVRMVTAGGESGRMPMYVAETERPLPRAFVALGVTMASRAEFEGALDSRVEGGRIQAGGSSFRWLPAELTRYDPEHVTVKVKAPEAGVVVLGDLFHPFWIARVDGRPEPIRPALFLFRGVDVPAGEHEVEFVGRVPYLSGAVGLSVLSAGAVLLAACRWRRPG